MIRDGRLRPPRGNVSPSCHGWSLGGISAQQLAQHRSTERVLVAIQITHVRLSASGIGHDSITRYRWRNESTGQTGESDKPTMVTWVDTAGNSAYVSNGSSRVTVGVVRPQIHANGV